MKAINLIIPLVAFCFCAVTASAQTLLGSFASGEGDVYGLSFADSGTPTLYGSGYAGSNPNTTNYFGLELADGNYTQVLNIPIYPVYGLAYGVAVFSGTYAGDPYNYVAPNGGGYIPVYDSAGAAVGEYATSDVIAMSAIDPYTAGSQFYTLDINGAVGTTGPDPGQPSDVDLITPDFTIASDATDISYDPGTGDLWAIDSTTAYNYDAATGNLLGSFALPSDITGATGIAFDTDTDSLYVSNDTSTIYIVSAPEPSALFLMAVGLALLVARFTFLRKVLE